MPASTLLIRHLGLTDYLTTWHAMQAFTSTRTEATKDELWLTEHPSVYTLGLNRKEVRLPSTNAIPVVLTDRGGKITYHGAGQVIVYLLLDLKRRQLNSRQLVSIIENSIIQLLGQHKIPATARKDAPGVYVNDCKIASLGLRLKNNMCYHGLSLNVNMDLTPFLAIDPCGYQDLQMTQTMAHGMTQTPQQVGALLLDLLTSNLALKSIIAE